jgi:hypothetical protein
VQVQINRIRSVDLGTFAQRTAFIET